MNPLGGRPADLLRSGLILVVATLAIAAHLSCRDSTPPREQEGVRPTEQPDAQKQPELEGGRLAESVQTQKTINRYFQDTVVRKLEPCWARLEGTGTIDVKLVFARAANGWTGRTVEAVDSPLSPDQTAAAATCLQQAVQGTTLPLPPRGNDEAYTLHWSWPVPLPPDADQQFAAMQKDNGGGSGTSGCDGHGAKARCVTCAGQPLSCIAVCVGGDPPCTMTENPLPGGFSRTCTVGSGCASGGLFGVVGSRMIF